jgi:type IV secretion system protein VirB4
MSDKLLKERNAAFQESRPLSELIPWLHEIAPGFLLCKDGSILAGYQYKGIDILSTNLTEQQNANQILDSAFADFDGSVNLWMTSFRRKTVSLQNKEMPEIVSQTVADRWSNLINQNLFRNRNFIFVQIKPPSTFTKALEVEGQRSINENKGLLKSLYDSFTYAFSYKERLFSSIDEINMFISNVNVYLRSFEAGISHLSATRIQGDVLMGVLNEYTSPSYDGSPLFFSQNSFLDSRLGSARIEATASTLIFDDYDTKHAVVLSVKDFPDHSAGQLQSIAFMPFELTISQCMQFWDYDVADKHIDNQRDFFEQNVKSMFVNLKEWVMNTELNQKDKDNELAYYDSDVAKEEHSKNRVAGLYNLTIVVYGDTADEAIENARIVSERLKHNKFLTYRERMHALSAFAGTFPGQYQEPVRWFYFSGPNFSDLALLFMPDEGKQKNDYLSKEFNKQISSVAVFKTRLHTPYHFNYHVGELGHTFFIGPTRSGKSVFDNFGWTMCRQFGAQVYIFDKDATCRIPTLLQGGQFIRPGVDKIKINPMSLLYSPGGQEFLVEWISYLLTAWKYEMTAEDNKALWAALDMFRETVRPELLRLSSLKEILPTHLLVHLEPWIGNGSLASFFDHNEDAFALSDITDIDITSIFTINQTAAIALMDYVFFKIEQRLDGRLTIINIEELWYPLKHPKFAAKLSDWLRAKAKQNVMLFMASQSLDELVKSGYLSLFLGGVATKIFLPNHMAKSESEAELYRNFGLNDDDISVISGMEKFNEYLIIQEDRRQIIQAHFPKDILSVLTSNKSAQNIMDWAIENHPDSFKSAYMSRMMESEER